MSGCGVQTFLPYSDFRRTATVLDLRRLGKQRVETLQILRALTFDDYGWSNHPAVTMWVGYTPALVTYGVTVTARWVKAGFADTVSPQLVEFLDREPLRTQRELREDGVLPPWLGLRALHRSHQAALLRKDPEHYAPLFPAVDPELPYVWPDARDEHPTTPVSAWVVRAQPEELETMTRQSFVGLRPQAGEGPQAPAGAGMLGAAPALANHPVFVEGNCFGPGVGSTTTGLQRSPVPPGSCGDYDGDGRIGGAEDADMDNTYGTIGAAVAAVASNGRVTMVRSGTYPESVRLEPVEGASIVLDAAPGVDANIDAVVQGEAGGPERAEMTGIVVDGCRTCGVTIRNITVRNWLEGIRLRGRSQALLDHVRSKGNLDYGIRLRQNADAAVRNSTVVGNGYRKDAAGAGEAQPGIGNRVHDDASAVVTDSSVPGNRAAGIKAPRASLRLRRVQLFDNHPNLRLYR